MSETGSEPEDSQPLESWCHTWRKGIAPQLSDAALEHLRDALADDSPTLVQGMICDRSPPRDSATAAPTRVCGIGLCALASGCRTIAEVEEFFANVTQECDRRLGEPGACRRWLNWWDSHARAVVVRSMYTEVEAELFARRARAADRPTAAAEER